MSARDLNQKIAGLSRDWVQFLMGVENRLKTIEAQAATMGNTASLLAAKRDPATQNLAILLGNADKATKQAIQDLRNYLQIY